MTPQEKAELDTHLKAIAKILYKDSDPAKMQTLEGIEVTVRQKIQQYVSPELGFFLSKNLPRPHQGNQEPSKAPSES
jgi:hypothetical protein